MKDKGHTDEHKLMKESESFSNMEDLLSLAIQGTGAGIWDWTDVNKEKLWWSPKFYEIIGFENGEIDASFSSFRNMIHPDDIDRVLDLVNKHLYEGVPYDVEMQLRTKSGSFKWIHSTGQAKFDDLGKPLRMVGLVIDIDEKKRFHNLIEQASSSEQLGAWELNLRENKLFWTPRTKLLHEVPLDYEPDLATAINFYKKGKSRNIISKAVNEAIKDGKSFSMQLQIVTAKGKERWIKAKGTPEFQKGICVKIEGSFQDIHEQKLKEIKLAESEERYRLLAENMQSTVCTHELDGRYNYVSPSFKQNFGYSSDEVLGKKPIDFVHKDDISHLSTLMNDLFDGGIWNSMKRKDGAYLWCRLKAYVIEVQGEATGLQTETYIIHDSKEYEQNLAKLTDRFTLSLEAAKIGIYEWDVVANKLIWDDQMYKLYGIAKDSFSGVYEAWRSGLHPDDVDRGDNEINLALSGEKDFDSEFRVIWPDKSIHHIRSLGKVERDEAGNAIRMIGANWDITDVKESENLKIHAKSLEIKNKELEQFTYVASHDLQEPLRTVSSFVDLLLAKYKNNLDTEGSRILGYISGASERMKALVSGLLDYSRIGRKVELKKVDCQKIVNQVIEDFSLLIEESGASITVDKLPELVGYETELRMVFQNLIANAIKFRKKNEGLKIKLSAVKQLNHEWLFTVQDNGIGIEEQYKERIFLIFQRLHTRDKYEGTGIGLAHCKKIVEMHRGKIWIKSTINKGATFFFTISFLKK